MSNAEHLANVMVEAFIAAVERGVDLVPVVADSTSTAKIAPFIKQFPGRLVNVGIAEQSMVGTAAGLALGLPPLDAVKVGHAAAALSVTAFGAQGGMPRMEQLLPLLADGWKEKLGL